MTRRGRPLFRPIHSSRVSKAGKRASGGAQPTELHVNDTELEADNDVQLDWSAANFGYGYGHEGSVWLRPERSE